MDPQIDEQVAKLLGGLKKVEAPQNFESRVMSRLSTSRAETGSRFGFLKLALPTAALAGLGMFLFLSGYLGGDVPTVNVVSAGNDKVESPAPKTVPQEQAVSQNNSQAPSEFRAPEIADSKPQPQASQPPALQSSQPPSLKDKKRPAGGGSQDFGSGDGGRTSAPGIDTNSRPGTDPDMERLMRRPTILASDVLKYTGITAEFRGGGWAVGSVTQKSVAERVGLKPGDLILSLNDIRIGKATAFPSGVDIKLIRVNRGGKILDLKF
jgi:membrane-associated protease RseP (regulator of RpoE activity)